jgi:hypothetical protein
MKQNRITAFWAAKVRDSRGTRNPSTRISHKILGLLNHLCESQALFLQRFRVFLVLDNVVFGKRLVRKQIHALLSRGIKKRKRKKRKMLLEPIRQASLPVSALSPLNLTRAGHETAKWTSVFG